MAGSRNVPAGPHAQGPPLESQSQYAPFERNDAYGLMGKAKLPLAEVIRLVIMSVLVAPLRVVTSVGCLILCHATLRLAEALLPASSRTSVIPALGSFWCRACARCLGLWVTWERIDGDRPDEVPAAGLVCNHGSWTDILIHLGRYWCSFAAREGTQDLALIGYISKKLQCVYVNRLKPGNGGSAGVSSQIRERMLTAAKCGHNGTDRLMLLFPEGTTTNGRYLLPFKTGAFLAGVPLRPIVIKYDQEARLSPCWDTINVWRLFWLLLCQPLTRITCVELPVYVPSKEEQADPSLYAENVRQYMMKYSKLKASSATFATKMEYHQKLLGKMLTGTSAERAAAAESTKKD